MDVVIPQREFPQGHSDRSIQTVRSPNHSGWDYPPLSNWVRVGNTIHIKPGIPSFIMVTASSFWGSSFSA